MTEKSPLLFIVTGSRGAGKTTFCARLVDAAREAGWETTGVLSRPVFEGSMRTSIEAQDLRGGDTRPLAVRSEQPTPGTKHWKFDNAAIDWCNQVFAVSTPTDLLVVDELGPLEFEQESGFQSGIAAVDTQDYAIALVVVRAEMLGPAMLRWPDANLVEIDTPDDSLHKAEVIAGQLF